MKILFLILSLNVMMSSAQACRSKDPLTKGERESADLVFIGKYVSGSLVKDKKAVVLTFEIEKILKGKYSRPLIEVYFARFAGGLLEEADFEVKTFRKRYGQRIRVGTLLPETIRKKTQCGFKDGVRGDGQKIKYYSCTNELALPFAPTDKFLDDRPWVIGGWCRDIFMSDEDGIENGYRI